MMTEVFLCQNAPLGSGELINDQHKSYVSSEKLKTNKQMETLTASTIRITVNIFWMHANGTYVSREQKENEVPHIVLWIP